MSRDLHNKKEQPLVTIITPTYNSQKRLKRSIESVLNQSYENIEYIIIDGASTDGTVAILKEYDNQIDYWISEPDGGIYEALNKGLSVAKGEYVAILNGDDFYEHFAVEESIKAIEKSGADYSIASVQFVDKKIVISPIYPLVEGKVYQDMPYPHVTAFVPKRVYDEVGEFTTDYRIAGDHDMALKIHLAGYRATFINQVIAQLSDDGVSDSLDATKESRNIAIAYGKSRVLAYKDYAIYWLKFYLVRLLPTSILHRLLKLKGSRFQFEEAKDDT
jgi:glycosyltransferase involved in cell wall biosynthesis